ncbi:50S ribosomal protein L21 [Prochlorococcus sp. MIT 1223]|uniref:50S ribosomal protein L21 n=1 Tax=Prochlorococcus sp. MIT 1223 TaxID=3096217 RepID=UPI002A75AC15|nr:50S ribosomal protein L21 [Prochlorococcus sp. MIT 1223]
MTTQTSDKKTLGQYAIVETSGTQFWLEPNRYYDLDRINADIDEKIILKNVLLLSDGKTAKIGKPYVEGARVELKVLAHRRGPKILVYKMRPKKKTRRKNGHRQELTRVMVESISIGGKAKSEEKKTKSTKSSIKTKETEDKPITPKTAKKGVN